MIPTELLDLAISLSLLLQLSRMTTSNHVERRVVTGGALRQILVFFQTHPDFRSDVLLFSFPLSLFLLILYLDLRLIFFFD